MYVCICINKHKYKYLPFGQIYYFPMAFSSAALLLFPPLMLSVASKMSSSLLMPPSAGYSKMFSLILALMPSVATYPIILPMVTSNVHSKMPTAMYTKTLPATYMATYLLPLMRTPPSLWFPHFLLKKKIFVICVSSAGSWLLCTSVEWSHKLKTITRTSV